MREKIIALIVTYGNAERFNNLEKGIRELTSNRYISEIVLVDNGTDYQLEEKLEEISQNLKLTIIRHEQNEGSAGGFGSGISYVAGQTEYSRLLILDDDSFVTETSLENIFDFESVNDGFENSVWSLFRQSKYADTFERNWDWNKNYYYNRVFGVSIQQKLFPTSMKKLRPNTDIANPLVAPYAGLLIPKQVVKMSVAPDLSYYLYMDDLDYTYRLSNLGININQIQTATLDDLEGSWSKESHFLQSYFASTNNSYRFLYMLRNWIYFVKKNRLVKSRFVFFVNLVLYYVVAFYYMKKTRSGVKKIKYMTAVILDGLHGKMGKIDIRL